MRRGLVTQIAIGLVCGILLALLAPAAARSVGLLGDIFIAALKAVAPVLVFVLVALLLSVVSALAACGASGVAGGSLLLIPMATSLLGISADVPMQVVAIGFIISVVQDSAETALNSSTEVLFTAASRPLASDVPEPLVVPASAGQAFQCSSRAYRCTEIGHRKR